ncbi:uncharacterized protein [Nicotiana tomentosiformis]|uniref:uncharacterized protein n=1 Tax=Nicotiana tomentosiformis TaxID=4098 RepID=UPI00388C3D2C
MTYADACDILDEMADTSSAWQSRANVPQDDPNGIHIHKELHDHGQAIVELTTTMNQLEKSQLQQVQGTKQVNAMEGVNVMVNKRIQHGQQVQNNQDQYEQNGSNYNQDDSYDDQSEEVLYANNYQGQRSNAPNQQWRSQGNNQNWGNQGQGNWYNGNNNNSNNWGNNNQNWGKSNNNWGGNGNQRGWNNNNQGNRGSGFQRASMYQQPNNPPPYSSQGQSSSNNEMRRIENMFKQMMERNADSDAQIASHTTSIRNLEVQMGQISQTLNTRPKGSLPSDMVVNLKGGNNTGHAMTVTTRSGIGGDTSTSNPKKIMSDDVVLQEDDEIQANDENVNDGVRIDIDDNMEETQNNVNPSREYVIDIPETIVTKAKASLPRPPPPYPQRLAKKNN